MFYSISMIGVRLKRLRACALEIAFCGPSPSKARLKTSRLTSFGRNLKLRVYHSLRSATKPSREGGNSPKLILSNTRLRTFCSVGFLMSDPNLSVPDWSFNSPAETSRAKFTAFCTGGVKFTPFFECNSWRRRTSFEVWVGVEQRSSPRLTLVKRWSTLTPRLYAF